MLYRESVKRVNPKSSHHKAKNFFLISFSLMLYLSEMMDAHWTYCGHHFVLQGRQIVRLYAVNLGSAVVNHVSVKP